MLEQTVWKASVRGETCHFGHEGTARAWCGPNGTVEKLVIRMPTEVPKGAVERELATARGLCSSVCDDDALNEADSELLSLRKIEEAAELACGLLWMVEDRREKVRAAFHALRDALGGSGSKGSARPSSGPSMPATKQTTRQARTDMQARKRRRT